MATYTSSQQEKDVVGQCQIGISPQHQFALHRRADLPRQQRDEGDVRQQRTVAPNMFHEALFGSCVYRKVGYEYRRKRAAHLFEGFFDGAHGHDVIIVGQQVADKPRHFGTFFEQKDTFLLSFGRCFVSDGGKAQGEALPRLFAVQFGVGHFEGRLYEMCQ